MKASKLVLGVLFAASVHLSSQINLKLKTITEDPSSERVTYKNLPFSSISANETPDYYIIKKNSYYTMGDDYYLLSSIKSINKQNFDINTINPSYKELKNAIYQKIGSKYFGNIIYTTAFMSDNNVFDFIYSYKDKNKSGDHVMSTTLFRYNEKNELLDAKILFQLPSLSANNFGEVLATYISSDKKKLCIINSIPYTNKENLKLECRIYDLKTYTLLDSKEFELPFVFKGRANQLNFRFNEFKDAFALSLITKDENNLMSLLAFYFSESDNFKPHTLFYPLEKYSDILYSLLKVPESNNLYLTIRYYDINKKYADKNSSGMGFAYAFIDIENNKISDLTEVELTKDYLKSMFGKSKKLIQDKSYIFETPLCIGANQFVLPILSFYIANSSSNATVYEYEKMILFTINNKSVQKSYEFDYNTYSHQYNLDINHLSNNKIILSNALSYYKLEEQMPGLIKDIKAPSDKKDFGLFYQIFDASSQNILKKDFLMVKNPANKSKYLSLITTLPIYDKNNPFNLKKLILLFDDGFVGFAEFTD